MINKHSRIVVILSVILALLGGSFFVASAASAAPPKKVPVSKKAPVKTTGHVGQTPSGCSLKANRPERLGNPSNKASAIVDAYCKQSSSARGTGIKTKVERCRIPAVSAGHCPTWVNIGHGRKFIDRDHDYALDSEVTFGLTPPINYAYRVTGSITWSVRQAPVKGKTQPRKVIITPFNASAVLRGSEYDIVAH